MGKKKKREAGKMQEADSKTPIDICKKKWRYIREQYVKCKKTAKEKSGDGRKGKSKYDALLEWLSPFVKHRQSDTNITDDQDQDLDQSDREVSEIASHSSCPSPTQSLQGRQSPFVSESKVLTSKKRKVLHDPIDEAILRSLSTENDEANNFAKVVADSIRKMPRRAQLIVKKKITDIIFDAELQLCNTPTESTTEIGDFSQATFSSLDNQANNQSSESTYQIYPSFTSSLQ
eukprot:gene7855-13733_t